ncbi:DNA polymerase delta subunit 4-like isoform X2 [Patiria miniata]|uniref:DNA polymerase delta subunit 4 n=1 Tax=Patiria miniata TaxID=46514 RepID=A0A914A4B7_PATMI|nr:DNA polymerase delta subunit 4-like isoform X2 [Patiria miniata]
MSGKQRLITDVFAQHKKELSRVGKTKVATTTVDESVHDVDSETAQQLLRDKEIDVLKQFDLCWEYGPCTGISRLERWERAEKHGMNPPDQVRRLIMKHEDETNYTQSLWHDYPL